MDLRRLLGSLDRGGPRPALLVALACLIGLALTGVVALLIPIAHAGDASSLRAFTDLSRPRLTTIADLLSHLVDPGPLVVAVLALMGVSIARGRPRMALVVGSVVVLSVLTSELLKPLLADTSRGVSLGAFSVGEASWPSGHATSSMCLALCAVLVAPRRLRPLAAAVGTAVAVGVSFSILVLGWHFPSDILGGYLVAATWVSLGIAVLRAVGDRESQRSTSQLGPSAFAEFAPVVMAALAAAGFLAVALMRPEAVATFATGHKPFLAGALTIAGLAWALASGLALALRR